MSDDVKVGDRFEHSRTGGIAVCTGAQVTDSERYPCEFQARGEKPYPAECYLNEPYWRRIPREAPTIEERRAALRVGDVIKDPALLAKGMRVVGVSGLSVTLLEPREDPTGWNDADTPRFLSDEACAEYGVTFIGWANLVEAKPPAGKPDPTPTGLIHLLRADGGTFCEGFGMRQGDTVTGDAYQFTCEDCRRMWAPHYQPAPPPRGLPFKYAPASYPCKDSDKHDGTLCLTCEGIIAGIMERRDKDTAMLLPPWLSEKCARYEREHRPEPHRPSDTGMGGACGPVMGRLR